MSLSQESIDELKKIHLEEFNEQLSDREAWDMGYRLLGLAKALAKAEQDDKVIKNK